MSQVDNEVILFMVISAQWKIALGVRLKETYARVSDYRYQNQMSDLFFIIKELILLTENN